MLPLLLLLAFSLLLPAAPVSVLPTPNPLSCFTMSGAGTLATSTVEGMPFTSTIRVKTGAIASTAKAWDIRPRCFSTPVRVTKGDTMLATFWLRTLSAPQGKGYTTFVLEQNVSPYAKSVSFTATAAAEWKKVEIPFTMAETYAANAYNFSFWVVFPNQEVEIGGLSILDYGPGVSYSSLNLTAWPYDGHAVDAPWRGPAAARIEKYRKGELVVVAHDDSGNLVPNAQVSVRMKRHAFGFGTAVAGDPLMANTADGQKYRDNLKSYFNKVVTENALKWPFYETWARAQANFMLPWFAQNGFTMVRGHNIIWPGKTNLPADVVSLLNATPVDAAKLRARINTHIPDVAAFALGKVTEWDVLNEPIANNDIEKVLGRAELAQWFKQARAADPSAKLYVNEYNILEAGGADLAHQNAYADYVQSLLDNGAPLDGLGLQSHFNTNLTPPDRVLELLDRFAAFNKDLQITEFDVNLDDEQVQADFTRDFLTAAFSHPAVRGFLTWGFWEGAHSSPKAAMFRKDWTTRPSFDVWNELIFRQWWTDTTGLTGPDGVFRTRGFLGDYDIEITQPGQPAVTTLLTLKSNAAASYAHFGKPAPARISAEGIANAASYRTGSVVPGEMVVIFGSGLGPVTLAQAQFSANLYLPTTLADTQVLFDGKPAPLVYTAQGQVSAVAPYGLSDSVRIQVSYLGVVSNEVTLPVTPAAPGIFACADRTPVLFNFSAPEAARTPCLPTWQPPKPGDIVTFFITGEGAVTPAVSDGHQPGTQFPKPVRPLKVFFGGVEAQPCPASFVGLISPGVTQVNTCIPAGADGTLSLR